MRANSCPCCGSALLRHARRKGVYWFCTSCHQEMMPLSSGQLPTCVDAMKQRCTATSLTLETSLPLR
jgi:ribosomal protein L37AE/L43A